MRWIAGVLVVSACLLSFVLTSCGSFPNRRAGEQPTEPLEIEMPVQPDVSRRVRGVVHLGDGLFPTPVAFVDVEILEAGRVAYATSTDHAGKFLFADDVARGTYEMRVTGAYAGSTRIVWRGAERTGFEIVARPR